MKMDAIAIFNEMETRYRCSTIVGQFLFLFLFYTVLSKGATNIPDFFRRSTIPLIDEIYLNMFKC